MSLLSCFVGLFVKFVAVFKRLLCFLHIKRRRKNSGSLLPLHTDLKAVGSGETLTSLPSNEVTMASWDSWGDDADGGFRGGAGSTDAMYQQQHSAAAANSRYYNKKQQIQPEPEPEADYFQELNLEPAIRKTQKIYIRKKDDNNMHSTGRLAMTSDIPIVSGELGIMDDVGSGWADEAMEDLSNEALSSLRETRRNERVNKIAQHQERKGARDGAIRQTRRDNLSAVKLS